MLFVVGWIAALPLAVLTATDAGFELGYLCPADGFMFSLSFAATMCAAAPLSWVLNEVYRSRTAQNVAPGIFCLFVLAVALGAVAGIAIRFMALRHTLESVTLPGKIVPMITPANFAYPSWGLAGAACVTLILGIAVMLRTNTVTTAKL